jgi:hypothetical protein
LGIIFSDAAKLGGMPQHAPGEVFELVPLRDEKSSTGSKSAGSLSYVY